MIASSQGQALESPKRDLPTVETPQSEAQVSVPATNIDAPPPIPSRERTALVAASSPDQALQSPKRALTSVEAPQIGPQVVVPATSIDPPPPMSLLEKESHTIVETRSPGQALKRAVPMVETPQNRSAYRRRSTYQSATSCKLTC